MIFPHKEKTTKARGVRRHGRVQRSKPKKEDGAVSGTVRERREFRRRRFKRRRPGSSDVLVFFFETPTPTPKGGGGGGGVQPKGL